MYGTKPLIFVRFARVTYTVVTLSGDKKCSQKPTANMKPNVLEAQGIPRVFQNR
jgi:hypothetical protein